MKRLLSNGIGDCYYLGPSFRNGDAPSRLHSFEFTMLELYKTGVSYREIANIVLEMFQYILKKMGKNNSLMYGNKKISFEHFEEYTVEKAFCMYAGLKKGDLFNHELFMKTADKKGYQIYGFSYEDVFSQMYVQEVEPYLGMNGYPTLLFDYPIEFAALASPNPDKKTAQRFEIYVAGIEVGDCYTELRNSTELKKRFEHEDKLRTKTKKIPHPIDKGFIDTIEYGLPECSGIAIGMERLGMIITGAESLQEIQLISVV